MLDLGGVVTHLDVGEGVGAGLVANQHRVALRIIARAKGDGCNPDQPAVAVVGMAGRDAFADDGAARIFAEVDHLGAGVGLLMVVGDRDRIKLADRVVATQYDGRILPGNRRAGLDLGPRNTRVDAFGQAAFGDEVVNAADAVFVARIPVLHRRVLDVGVVERHQLDHRRM